MTAPIDAVQHVRKMRGGSQAHLLRCSDGGYYVTKFQGNPQHTRILANEMFATKAGRWLNLPMPDVAIIHVSDWLVEKTPDLGFENRLATGEMFRRPASGVPVCRRPADGRLLRLLARKHVIEGDQSS